MYGARMLQDRPEIAILISRTVELQLCLSLVSFPHPVGTGPQSDKVGKPKAVINRI
jgi:hypothetical protein